MNLELNQALRAPTEEEQIERLVAALPFSKPTLEVMRIAQTYSILRARQVADHQERQGQPGYRKPYWDSLRIRGTSGCALGSFNCLIAALKADGLHERLAHAVARRLADEPMQ
jgi:hypothetical protein